MEVLTILIKQVLIMFLLIVIGFILRKKVVLNMDGVKQLSSLMVYICNPAVMILSFNIEFSLLKVYEFIITFFLSVIITILGILVARIFFDKEHSLEQFGVIFCNAGFMGIPLVQSILGNGAVLYLTIYMTTFTLFSWTYGIFLISKDRNMMSLKNVINNPATISFIVGLIIFISPIKLPDVLSNTLDLLGSCNTPLGMIILGCYLANSTVTQIVENKIGYKVSLYRLVVAPLATIAVLSLVPNSWNTIRMTLLIASSTPVGVMLAIFSQMFGKDYEYGARIVSLSTVLSLLTIPFMIIVATLLWQIG